MYKGFNVKESFEKLEDLILFFKRSGLKRLRFKNGEEEFEFEAYEGGLLKGKSEIPKSTHAPHREVSDREICSPMVGTFYAGSKPGATPFVKVGDTVAKGDVVGIVEAMKVMNEVKAEASGKIAAILVEDGCPVEFGSRLFLLS